MGVPPTSPVPTTTHRCRHDDASAAEPARAERRRRPRPTSPSSEVSEHACSSSRHGAKRTTPASGQPADRSNHNRGKAESLRQGPFSQPLLVLSSDHRTARGQDLDRSLPLEGPAAVATDAAVALYLPRHGRGRPADLVAIDVRVRPFANLREISFLSASESRNAGRERVGRGRTPPDSWSQ